VTPAGWVFSLFSAPGGWAPDGAVPAWSTNTSANTTSLSGSVPTAGDLVTAIATMFTSTTPVVSGVSAGWALADTDSVPHMAEGVADASDAAAGTASVVFSWTEKHGQTGLLIPYDDVGALEQAMLDVLERPELRARLVEGGRRALAERFDPASLCARVVTLYERVGAMRGPR
jgi:hypothetical protein